MHPPVSAPVTALVSNVLVPPQVFRYFQTYDADVVHCPDLT